MCFHLFPTFSHLLPSIIFKHGDDMPRRAKDVERFGEAVIVDEASIYGEYAHEQDQVTPAEEGVPDLQGERHSAGNQTSAPQASSEDPCSVFGKLNAPFIKWGQRAFS